VFIGSGNYLGHDAHIHQLSQSEDAITENVPNDGAEQQNPNNPLIYYHAFLLSSFLSLDSAQRCDNEHEMLSLA